MEQQAAISAKASKAMRYPLMVMVLGLGSAVYMIGFTLPALTGLLTEFGGELPLAPRILMAIGDGARAYGLQAILLLASIGVAAWAYVRTEQGKEQRDRLVLRLPLMGPLLHTIAMFRFVSSLTAMVKSGLPLLEALRLTSRVVGNRTVARAIETVHNQVVQGVAFSRALKDQSVFPTFVTQLIAVGEQAGNLHQQLQTISDSLAQETQKRISSLTGVIEPAMTLMMGLVVGFMAIAVLSAVYGTLGQIR
jgi:type IV pilus assembly protein PilC